MSLDLKLIKIGNSWGFRIPKAVLTKCGFSDYARMTLKRSQLIIEPVPDQEKKPRQNWDEAFEKINQAYLQDDLDWDFKGGNEWDQEEWEWK